MAMDLIYHRRLKRKGDCNKVNISHALTAVESGAKYRRHGAQFAQWGSQRNELN